MALLIGLMLTMGLMVAIGVWGVDSRDGIEASDRNGSGLRRPNVWW